MQYFVPPSAPRSAPAALHAPIVTRSTHYTDPHPLSLPFFAHTGEEHEAYARLDLPYLAHNRTWLRAGMVGMGAAAATVLGMRRNGWAVAGLGALGALGTAYATTFEPTHPVLEHVTLRLPRLPAALDGLRIGQLSDMHLGQAYSVKNLAWALAQMEREQPDVLVFTGDFISQHEAIPAIPALLRGVHAPLGVYAIAGNHDYWPGIDDVRGALAVAGMPMLLNRNLPLQWNGGTFWLAGVEDIWHGQPDWQAALGGIPEGGFTVLLCHAPDGAQDAANYPVDLQLSGHTHGGHIRLPLLGSPSLPRFGVRYVCGQYRIGAMQLYVARGLGGMPLRFGCKPEATILTLRCGA